jgi:DNA-binding CsgD family transcriptional regulator
MTATQLTDREQQIRTLVADGLTNEDIAVRLKISRKTVESHLRMLFRKLGVSRREQVSLEDLVPVPDPHAFGATSISKLRELEEQLRSYETAIRRITDRQTPLFSERVEITVTIGDTAADDAVVERRWTTPKPYVVYRVAGPILPERSPRPLTAEDLEVSCEVVGRDVGVAVETIRNRKQWHQMLVTFQPGLEEETEWVLRYRAPGLWDPLRERGEDFMHWVPGAMERADTATSITGLTVRFIFPSDTTAMDVAEWRAVGVTEKEHLPDGRQMLIWREPLPAGASHRWLLKMTREPRQW